MTAEITCLLDGRFALAECPTWDERRQKLFFTDIKGKAIHALDWKSRELETWTFAKEVGSFALCEDGRLIVAVWDQVVLFDPQSGAQQAIASIEADNPHTRLNDGKAGPDGAFWVGTMDNRSPRQPVAGLYRVAPDGKVTQILDGLHVSNGLAWSPDGTAMYHADSSPAGWTAGPLTRQAAQFRDAPALPSLQTRRAGRMAPRSILREITGAQAFRLAY